MRTDDLGVSEVIGSMLLLGVAVVTAVAIYSLILPVPLPTAEVNAYISAYDTGESFIFLHEGGVSLDIIKVEITIHDTNSVSTYFFYDVEIGGKVVIPNTNDNITAIIYCEEQIIFEGDFNKSTQGVE